MAADRDELITPGGIRLVGRAKDLVSDAALAGLAPPGETDLLFAARFDVRPRLGTSVLPPCLDVLSRVIGKYFPEARSLDRSQDQRQRLGRALAFEWQTVQVEERWTGELLWRTPHPILRGALLTIQAILTDQPGRVNLTIRSGVAGGLSGAFGPVGCGQSVPSFLPEFNRLVRLVYGGRDGTPRALGADDIEGLVRDVLLSETRDVPTALLSPTESGEYLVPPEQLADELLGLAHLYVMDRHSTTYRLTDALGDRRLSCYWGALRIYQPGFSCADSPHDHPLVFGERLLDPLARAQLVGELALKSRRTVPSRRESKSCGGSSR